MGTGQSVDRPSKEFSKIEIEQAPMGFSGACYEVLGGVGGVQAFAGQAPCSCL